MRRQLIFSLLVLLSPAAALSQTDREREIPVLTPGTLVVQVRGADGTALQGFASVRLYSLFVSYDSRTTTIDGARATFRGVPIGEYRVEVTAAGYEKVEEDAQVYTPGGTSFVMINLRPEGAPASATPSGPPLLAPKARRELEQAQELLKANKVKEAIEHLEKAYKMAPAYPDICYMLGVAYQRANRLADARTYLEKTLSLDPNHPAALNSLGANYLMQSDLPQALQVLERALLAAPNSWKTHWMLATLRARMREVPKALEHVDKAIELSAGLQPEMYLLRGQLLEALGKFQEAVAQWEEFLTTYPDRPEVASVKQRLEKARIRRDAPAVEVVSAPAASAVPGAAPLAAVSEEAETLNVKWAPPDVDEVSPEVEPGVTCPLPEVLSGAHRRAAALVETLQSFTAIEKIRRQALDAKLGSLADWTFEYQALIEQPRPGHLAVTDYRTLKGPGAATNIQSNGIPAMALILHPFYTDDFEMRCEGRAALAGQAAWVVHFRQRDDRLPRIRSYYVQGRRYAVRLKGRAWISVNSGHVMRLETDLLQPVPELRLTRDHLLIDYAPVKFDKRNVRVWLPAAVGFYTDFGGKRYHYRHIYSDFMLFAVDTRQKIADPKLPPEPPPQ